METLTQIKDRVAQKHGFASWKDLVLKWHFNSTLKPIDLTIIVAEAMQEYANTRCIRQRELCAGSATTDDKSDKYGDIVYWVDKSSILNAPLATEE